MNTDWICLLKHACFAAMGGLVREIANEGEHNIIKFIAGGFVGVFTGLVCFFLCKHCDASEYMTAAFTGLGGYSGAPLCELLSRRLRKWLSGKP